MTKTEVMKIMASPTYPGLLSIYKAHKTDNKHDQFFAAVTDSKPGQLHFNLLSRRVSNIIRKLNATNAWTQTPVPQPVKAPIVAKEIKLGKKDPEPRVKIDTNPSVRYEDLPADLQKRFNENGKLTGEIKSFHALLKTSKSDNARKELAEQIDAAEKTIRNNWEAIDKWWNEKDKYNAMPAPKTENTAALLKKIEASKKYISRNIDSKKPDVKAKVAEAFEFLKVNGIDWTPKKK
jgi:hypothetical protein